MRIKREREKTRKTSQEYFSNIFKEKKIKLFLIGVNNFVMQHLLYIRTKRE